MAKCYTCLKKIGTKLEKCPFCLSLNLDTAPFKYLPEDLKNNIAEDCKPISKEPTEEKIAELLLQAAKDLNFKITNYEIEMDETNKKNVMTITPQNDIHDIILEYNPIYCRSFNEKELRAMLRHELIHPITYGQVTWEGDSNAILKKLKFSFAVIYFEMINHKKHLKLFPNDVDFRRAKNKTISHSIMSLLLTRNELESMNEEDIRFRLNVVLDHTIYFFYDGPQENFRKWINKYGFQAIWKFFSWINDDMNYLQENVDDQQQILSLLRDNLFLLTHLVDVKQLFSKNEINVDEGKRTKVLMDPRINHEDPISSYLISTWKDRFSL